VCRAQGIVLGLLQGAAEPFPISSLGHGVILPRLAGWHIRQNDERFLTFLVATHLATAIVLLVLFRKDWVRIVRGIVRSLQMREIRADDVDARLGWLLIVGTIPAGVVGLLLEMPLRRLFASPPLAALFLIVNGVALLVFERLRKRPAEAPSALDTATAKDSDARLARLTWRQATGVGVSQAAALIPGISRSGFTMGGGLLSGLSNDDAVRYAFLLSTPIIGAAAVLKLPQLLGSQGNGLRGPALVAGVCAAFTTFQIASRRLASTAWPSGWLRRSSSPWAAEGAGTASMLSAPSSIACARESTLGPGRAAPGRSRDPRSHPSTPRHPAAGQASRAA